MPPKTRSCICSCYRLVALSHSSVHALRLRATVSGSIIKVFDQYFSLNSLQKVVEYFNSGWGVEVSDQMASQDYLEGIKEIPGLKEAIKTLAISESPELMASATEFVLEGLHLHQKLNKEMEGGRVTYGK